MAKWWRLLTWGLTRSNRLVQIAILAVATSTLVLNVPEDKTFSYPVIQPFFPRISFLDGRCGSGEAR
jgi:hypothetical protein